jgi:hypothetical protein
MPRRVCLIGTVCAALAGLGGCDRAKTGETIVRGQILYRGEPVAGGLIVLAPNSDRGSSGPLATAVLNDDGSFKITGPDGKPVPAGWYRIAIAPRAGTVEPPTADRPYPGVPARFRNPALSGLEREIKSGTDNLICIDLDDS